MQPHAATPLVNGSYWTTTMEDEDILDHLVVVLSLHHGVVEYQSGRHHWSCSEREFLEMATPCLDGAMRRHQRLMEWSAPVAQPAMDMPVSIAVGDDGQEGLITEDQCRAMRASAEVMRQQSTVIMAQMEKRQSLTSDIFKERMAIASAAATSMEHTIAVVSSMVTSLYGYLGDGVLITDVMDGTRAPVDDPVVIRQALGYMDEEMALHSGENIHISPENINPFVDWLRADPTRISMLIPETKGMIGLRATRNKSHERHQSPWEVEADKVHRYALHILLKHGDLLVLFHSDIPVDETLIPTTKDLDDCFHHWTGPARPGTSSYVDAMRRAEGHHLHALRIMLLVQGIIDRTSLLGAETKGINLCQPASWHDRVRLIRDAEPDARLIGQQHIPFHDWLRACHVDLEHGQRVVLGRCDPDMVHPLSADLPPTSVLLTVQGKKGNFRVLYDRTDAPKRRASYTLTGSDFIAVDTMDPDVLSAYMHDRYARKDYLDIIPLARSALLALRQEEAIEAPFRALLRQQTGITDHEAKELIRWWKTKTINHRAIMDHDGKAMTMMIAQVATDRAICAPLPQSIMDDVLRIPGLMQVYRTSMKSLRLTVSHDTPWMKEAVVTGERHLSTPVWSEPFLPVSKLPRGRVVWEHPLWGDIPKDITAADAVTDTMARDIADKARMHVEAIFASMRSRSVTHHDFFVPRHLNEASHVYESESEICGQRALLPIAIQRSKNVFYLLMDGGHPTAQKISLDRMSSRNQAMVTHSKCHVHQYVIHWKMTHHGIEVAIGRRAHQVELLMPDADIGGLPWSFMPWYGSSFCKSYSIIIDGYTHDTSVAPQTLVSWGREEGIVKRFQAALRQQQDIIDQHDVFYQQAQAIVDQQEKAIIAREKSLFIARGHDPATWKDSMAQGCMHAREDQSMVMRRLMRAGGWP